MTIKNSNIDKRMSLIVKGKRIEADGVHSFELAHPCGEELPGFTAGSHLEVYLPGGLIRHYSLCNSPTDAGRYVIGVLRMEEGRGGSLAMSAVQVGEYLDVSAPRNNFELHENAAHSVLIAGGIGITPILAMARRLEQLGRSFEVHYLARSRQTAAFVDILSSESFAARSHFHFEDEMGGPVSLDTLISTFASGAQLYTCGPAGLMDAVFDVAAAKGWPEEALHREYFKADSDANTADAEAFEVVLNSTGERLQVPADRTMLEVLDEAGCFVPSSCLEGVCGTCVTAVLEGTPDHRDLFLSDQERKSNRLITPCCSRAKGSEIVLDL